MEFSVGHICRPDQRCAGGRQYGYRQAAEYAKANEEAARTAFPLLERSLRVWESKHSQHALDGARFLGRLDNEKFCFQNLPILLLQNEFTMPFTLILIWVILKFKLW